MTRRLVIADQPWDIYASALALPEEHPPMPMSPNFNAGPGSLLPVMAELENKRILMAMRWGLVPFFWDRPLDELEFNTQTARLESAGKTLSFRGPVQYRRALIPASGFYLWQGPKGDRQPYYVSRKDEPLCLMAGVWDEVVLNDELIFSFSIMSVPALDPVKGLASRMPLILDEEAAQIWMDISVPHKWFASQAVAGPLQVWAVDRRLGKGGANDPGLIEPVF